MHTDKKHVFSNTCGKIFKDRIILATQQEAPIPFRSIKSITLKKSYDKLGVLFIVMPTALLALPFIFTNEPAAVKAGLAILGALGVIICVLKIRHVYSLCLKTQSGRKVKMRVGEGNKKEAQKFILKATSMINNAKTVQDDYAGEPIIARLP